MIIILYPLCEAMPEKCLINVSAGYPFYKSR